MELQKIFESQGLKTARQKYKYYVAGRRIEGENVYAVLQGPRADATEALVLMAGWKNMDGVINTSGVALVLSLARYFKRELWSVLIVHILANFGQDGHCGQRTSFSLSPPTALQAHRLG